jgi:hypothetical protein
MAAYYKVDVVLNSQAVQVGLPSPQSVRVTLPNRGPQGLQGIQGEVGPVGPVGETGSPGADGREVELQTTESHVQWRYEGESEWTDLVALSAITGPQGIQGETGLTGAAGADGREVELRKTETHVQWRYEDEAEWTDLVALSEITGPQGQTGDQGPAGPANTLAIGTVTTGAAGTEADATLTGDSPAQTLNLVIPRGDKGDTGDQGPPGTQTTDASDLTTGTLADARLSSNVPLLASSNTFAQNQTLDGTNNVAPNQTAASGSSLMTRALGDARYYLLRDLNTVVINSWGQGGLTDVSGGSVAYIVSSLNVRANAGAGNRARWQCFLVIGSSRGIDWSKTVRGTILFRLNGDSRGTTRALIGENNSYVNGNPTRPCAGFKVTGNTLTAFVHDGTNYTEHGTATVGLSGNNWAFEPRVFEFISDGAGNISYSLDGAAITGGSGARTTQSSLSEAINFVSESDAACTSVTDIIALQVVVEQS